MPAYASVMGKSRNSIAVTTPKVHVVCRQAVFAAQEAHATAEGVAGHADIRRGARQGGEPVPRGGVHDVEPDRAGLDPGRPRARVDPDAAHLPGPQQHSVAQRPERPGVMTGALGGDPQATLGRPADGRRNVGR
jgi:hypothetical protein